MTSFPDVSAKALLFFALLFNTHKHKEVVESMGISHSKGSRLLNELRIAFNDELFVKFAQEMIPTETARRIAPEILKIVASLRDLQSQPIFDPSLCRRNFRLAATDNSLFFFHQKIYGELYVFSSLCLARNHPYHSKYRRRFKKRRCRLFNFPLEDGI